MPLTIERAPTPNFAKGRQGYKPEAFVIHVTEGKAEGTLSWFASSKSGVSAHYLVLKDGGIVQFVDDADTAWHAGRVDQPSWPLLKPRVNPNLYTIGVEHEGGKTDTWTQPQLRSSAALILDRAAAHRIPLHRERLVEHNRIFKGKSCPGGLNVNSLFAEISRQAQASAPKPGDRVRSEYFGENLILTSYVSDREWYFVRESELRRMGVRAATAWSQMPHDR